MEDPTICINIVYFFFLFHKKLKCCYFTVLIFTGPFPLVGTAIVASSLPVEEVVVDGASGTAVFFLNKFSLFVHLWQAGGLCICFPCGLIHLKDCSVLWAVHMLPSDSISVRSSRSLQACSGGQ